MYAAIDPLQSRIADSLFKGSKINLRKRYSEFDTLRRNLLMTFPLSEASMPPLPPKGVVSKFRPKFLDQRRVGLQYFFKYAETQNCLPATTHTDVLSQLYTS